jgi:hypothetical protein
MTTSSPTLDKSQTGTEISTQPTICISDETVADTILAWEADFAVDDYFAKAGLTVPTEGYTAVSNGRRLLPTDTVEPGATITVGRLVRNG